MGIDRESVGVRMSKFIITADSEDQNWLDAFNQCKGYDFKMHERVDDCIVDQIKIDIHQYNHEVACGPAILLKEVAE